MKLASIFFKASAVYVRCSQQIYEKCRLRYFLLLFCLCVSLFFEQFYDFLLEIALY